MVLPAGDFWFEITSSALRIFVNVMLFGLAVCRQEK